LSINNLQNVNGAEITLSADICSILSRLTTLCVKIISEWEEASPESSWRIPAMYQFFAELPLVWLTPSQANLTSLKLHVDVQWACLPKADLRGMHFSKLQKLDLGNYTFSHDW
jgi:hypothetical protein